MAVQPVLPALDLLRRQYSRLASDLVDVATPQVRATATRALLHPLQPPSVCTNLRMRTCCGRHPAVGSAYFAVAPSRHMHAVADM